MVAVAAITARSTLPVQGGELAVSTTPAQNVDRLSWFNAARFGMFIHWGVYSVPAGEWAGKSMPDHGGEWIMEDCKIPVSEYAKFAPQFHPEQFNARAWVHMATNAGMKYIVITSKHHDGFAMWRSDLSEWGIRATPFERDPLKELADECRHAGIRLCFYYSIMDWHHPHWPERRAWNDTASGTPDMERYVAYMKGQLKELLSRYGPIGILWFDGEWEKPWTHAHAVDLHRYVRSLQPDIIINNRIDKVRQGMGGMDKGQGVGDYGTPEQEIPANGFGPGVTWESCMTMNNTWGYRKDDHKWKSTQTLIRNLIDCASTGGNYLLNIGPTAEGLFPDASIVRLEEIGDWMNQNGEAIYDTTASPFKQEITWGRCTQKGDKLFLHVYNWPADGRLLAPLLNQKVKAWLLRTPGRKLKCKDTPEGLVIQLPASAPDKIASVIVVQVTGKILPAAHERGDGTPAQKR